MEKCYIKCSYIYISMRKKMKYIDVFAGCGGLSLGLHKAGLQGIFAVEKKSYSI